MDIKAVLAELKDGGADTVSALDRFLGDEELYCECLADFMEDKSFPALRDALSANEIRAAFVAAHTLKGVAGNLGLSRLYNGLCILVESLRAGKDDSALLAAQYAPGAEEYEKLNDLISKN